MLHSSLQAEWALVLMFRVVDNSARLRETEDERCKLQQQVDSFVAQESRTKMQAFLEENTKMERYVICEAQMICHHLNWRP